MIKVAGYCRVSTDHHDQINSFESQQRYFKEYIEKHSDWELYAIYADEGVTGTSTRKRTQFNKMIDDAYNGKFGLIITKEVSRFSRNLLDTISYTRELKSMGIGVIFMNDGFATTDPDAELRLSIMGSIAQEESRKTSSRVKWGQTRQMERGIVFGNSMLGYDVCDGHISINPMGAEVVKLIFRKYTIEQKSASAIAKELQDAGIKNRNNSSRWNNTSIIRILRNEKYAGDLVQKKTITPDFLTHKRKKNAGEEDLVIIHDHHTPIIDRELWILTQEELSRRNPRNVSATGHSNRYVFSGKIICAECGRNFISRCKTRKNGTSYRRWSCQTRASTGTPVREDGRRCQIGKQIRDKLALDILMKTVVNAPVDYSWIIQNLTHIVSATIRAADTFAEDVYGLEEQIKKLQSRKENVIDAFVSGHISAEELGQIRKIFNQKIDSLKDRILAFESSTKLDPKQVRAGIEEQIRSIVTCETYAEPYYRTLLNEIVIHKDGQLCIQLNHLPHIWVYQIVYHTKQQPDVPQDI